MLDTNVAAPAGKTPASSTARRTNTARVLSRWGLPILLLLVVVLASATTPHFMSLDNWRAILINTSIVGIVAVGMTPLTLSGNMFSLAASSSVVLAAVVFLATASSGIPVALAAALSLAVLLAVGLVQGLVVAAGLNPIITTLAAGAVILGSVTLVTRGVVMTPGDASIGWIALTSFLGFPLPVYVFIGYMLITWYLVERSRVGRHIVLIGANKDTAVNSGVSVRATTLWAFASLSVGMAIAGIVAAAQLQQVRATDLSTLTMEVVAAVLVGGTAISGGEGSPLRSALGALLIVMLGNVMLLHGWPTGYRELGVGILVVAVVSLLHVMRRRVS